MRRGRKRLFDPTIPAHIRQAEIPAGVYWNRRDANWYTIIQDGDKARRVKLADAKARLSDIHTKLDAVRGIDTESLDWLMGEYENSLEFGELAETTRDDYQKYRAVASIQKTKIGALGSLPAGKLDTPLFQAIVARIAKEGTQTKANKFMRYVRLVYSWGVRYGKAPSNPVKGVQKVKERKRQRLPEDEAWEALIAFARERGAYTSHRKGSLTPYLWMAMEFMYLCRLRSIEATTLAEDAAMPEGLRTNRRKGSRDNIVAWTPRLRAAWDGAVERRREILQRRGMPEQFRPKDRVVLVTQEGQPMDKGTFQSRWQAMITLAIAEGVITEDQRFGTHDNKRKGITDTPGTRHDKQHASGHKSERMIDDYDKELPVVRTAGKPAKPG